jgi:hypothetical protein
MARKAVLMRGFNHANEDSLSIERNAKAGNFD